MDYEIFNVQKNVRKKNFEVQKNGRKKCLMSKKMYDEFFWVQKNDLLPPSLSQFNSIQVNRPTKNRPRNFFVPKKSFCH